MTAKKLLTAFVGVAAAYWIYSKFRFSQSVTYVITRIGLGGSVLDPRINIDYTIYNPTAFRVEIGNIRAQLYLESGLKVADVYYNGRTVVAANSEAVLPLTSVGTLEGALSSIRELIRLKQAKFRLAGTVQVDGVRLPFDIKYSFDGI
jgi:LEA14-like dessication related protein